MRNEERNGCYINNTLNILLMLIFRWYIRNGWFPISHSSCTELHETCSLLWEMVVGLGKMLFVELFGVYMVSENLCMWTGNGRDWRTSTLAHLPQEWAFLHESQTMVDFEAFESLQRTWLWTSSVVSGEHYFTSIAPDHLHTWTLHQIQPMTTHPGHSSLSFLLVKVRFRMARPTLKSTLTPSKKNMSHTRSTDGQGKLRENILMNHSVQ